MSNLESVFNNEIIIRKSNRFSINLINARRNAGLTQTQAAKAIGLSAHTAINAYETRGHFPPLNKFLRLCELYKVSPNWLLDYPDNQDLLDEYKQEVKDQKAKIGELETIISMLKDKNLN